MTMHRVFEKVCITVDISVGIDTMTPPLFCSTCGKGESFLYRYDRPTCITINAQLKISEAKLSLRIR